MHRRRHDDAANFDRLGARGVRVRGTERLVDLWSKAWPLGRRIPLDDENFNRAWEIVVACIEAHARIDREPKESKLKSTSRAWEDFALAAQGELATPTMVGLLEELVTMCPSFNQWDGTLDQHISEAIVIVVGIKWLAIEGININGATTIVVNAITDLDGFGIYICILIITIPNKSDISIWTGAGVLCKCFYTIGITVIISVWHHFF